MRDTAELISDEQIEIAFGNANFGGHSKREVIRTTLLKYACDYHSGHTAQCIVKELGLVSQSGRLTKLGKEYLFDAYCNNNL